jgi:hypothetical protein
MNLWIAAAIKGATEMICNCGQSLSIGATVSVTKIRRTLSSERCSRAPSSSRPCVAAIVISGDAPALSSTSILSAIVPPVEIMSSIIKHARPRTSPTMRDLRLSSTLTPLVEDDNRSIKPVRKFSRHPHATRIWRHHDGSLQQLVTQSGHEPGPASFGRRPSGGGLRTRCLNG